MEIPSERKRRPSLRRRFTQFSLRGLLLLVAICAVWLGIAFHRAREQARAAAAIYSAHGYVVYGFQEIEVGPFDEWGISNVPPWLLDSVGVDFFHNVTSVVFNAAPATDDALTVVGALAEVRSLVFNAAGVSNRGLGHLNTLTKLQDLYIMSPRNNWGKFDPPAFDDAGLAALANLHELRNLSIEGARIGDEALEHLKGLPSLEWVRLQDTQVTLAGAEALSASLPSCTIRVSRGDLLFGNFIDVFYDGPLVPPDPP